MKFYFCFLALFLAFASCKKNDLNSLLNRKKLSYKKKLDSLAKIKFDEVIKEDVDTYPIF